MADARLLLERLERAEQFALTATGHGTLEPWMLWPGWLLHVGCDTCLDDGPHAGCWGTVGCHGYSDGCGCRSCAERQVRDIAKAQAA